MIIKRWLLAFLVAFFFSTASGGKDRKDGKEKDSPASKGKGKSPRKSPNPAKKPDKKSRTVEDWLLISFDQLVMLS